VIEVLRRVGVRIIGLDYLFSVSAESWLKTIEVLEAIRAARTTFRSEASLQQGRWCLIGWVASNEPGESELLLPIEDYLFSLPKGKADVGLANFYCDADGAVRRFVPTLFIEGPPPKLTFATLLAVKSKGMEPSTPPGPWVVGRFTMFAVPCPIGFVGRLGPSLAFPSSDCSNL